MLRGIGSVAALLALAACGVAPGGGSDLSPVAVTAEATTSVTPSLDGVFTIAFAGDVHFERGLRALLDDPEHSLSAIKPLVSVADITMVNLETAITDRGAPEPKTYTFRTTPAALTALAAAGIDVVSMANNHGVDFGAVGLEDTLAARARAPIAVIGIGEDADDAFEPYETTIEDTSVAIIAGTQLYDRTTQAWSAGDDSPGVASAVDPDRLLRSVRKASAKTDVVAVFLHWGTEQVDCPTSEQRALAASLIDAGADLIVGAHAHVLLGSGWTGNAYVNYGLGNLIWYHGRNESVASTGVLTVTIRDGAVAEHKWTPARIPTGGGVPFPLLGAAAEDAVQRWEDLRACTDLTGAGELRGSGQPPQ